ncbi:unnamed protein product [Microthlaspi erraticum]|uniref:F-box domain-containing protein n=1 Tax=Microthlaspi erraticum TaxID=1685480 RepID=A0A6D2HKP6_9BRAS|nr:unnamed protein product [Microthlaspi erraticum]
MDRISNLPDEIVCHILSFVSTNEAALTSVLSKRWRNLFAFTSNLCFEDKAFATDEDPGTDVTRSLIEFVNRVLAVSGDFPIKKFTLKWRIKSAHVSDWICNVLTHVIGHGVEDLVLHYIYSDYLYDQLLLSFFSCKTIVHLKLGFASHMDILPKNASLPALKTLLLDCIRFFPHHCGHEFEPFLSACPVLEEFTIICYGEWEWWCRVSSMTLQRMTIINFARFSRPRYCSITFDTPSLAYLKYSGFVHIEHPVVSLQSLVVAKLDISLSSREHGERDPTNLIEGLRNIQVLELSSITTSDIFYSVREAIPVFEKLSRLSIATELGSCWKLVPLLLQNSPNLETLVIKGPLHYCDKYGQQLESVCECLSGYSFPWSCHVKVLEITEYRGTKGELEQMKHILEKLPCLELVKVRAWAVAKFLFTKDLLMLPRACKIQLKYCQPSEN